MKKNEYVVAVFQVLSSLLFLFSMMDIIFSNVGWKIYFLLFVIIFVPVFSSYLIFKGSELGKKLAYICQIIPMLSISLKSFGFSLNYFFSSVFYIKENLNVGFQISLDPGFFFSMDHGIEGVYYVGFNMFNMFLIFLLYRSK